MKIIKLITPLGMFISLLLTPMAMGEYTNTSPRTEALVKKAHQKNASAMEELGDIYAKGDGVEADRDEAMTWYTLAAQKGSASANEKLWKMEGHSERKIKRIRKKYNEEATHALLAYLYLTHELSNMLDPEQIPPGIKTKPSPAPGYVLPPEYKPAIVKRYLQKGADPTARILIEKINYPLKARGMVLNVFALVARHNDFKTLDSLIAHGCTINNHGEHLIHRTFSEISKGNPKEGARMLQYLQNRGAHFKGIGDWGATWIMECACAGGHKAIEFLISQGVDPNASIENRYIIEGKFRNEMIGDTALLMATRNKDLLSMDVLIKANADLNYIWKGETVLDRALKDTNAVTAPASSYKKELARLKAKAEKCLKNPKTTKHGNATSRTYTKDYNVSHLLKLAGAKTSAELGAPEKN